MPVTHKSSTNNIASSSFDIAGVSVGTGQPCFIIAEAGLAHDGSLGIAHAYIDAAARAGANAVKFQTHIADAESTPCEPFRVKSSYQDASRYDYWKRVEFTAEQWKGLADHANEEELIFLSSPFSDEAFELLDDIGIPAWKVAAGEVGTLPMLKRMALTGKPVLLSSGMCTWEDLDAAVNCVRAEACPVGVFQCTTSYPCPPEKLGLNVLQELHDRYQCPVGLSDHAGVIYSGLAAVTLGSKLLEAHITLSRDCYGPDVSSSLTVEEFKQLVAGSRFIEAALRHNVDKSQLAKELLPLRQTFYKSVVLARDLPAGHRLHASDLTLKKPGTGVPAGRMADFIGRVLKHDLGRDEFVRLEDVA